ncbi:MAG: ABC transporter permease [Chloroflexi bacterium]|nr:ABC transporter permease [Chloroflexota bacterium]
MAQIQTVRRHALNTTPGVVEMGASLANFWRRRDLLWHMTVRHLRGQYKQSVLGFAWAFVNPLSQMLILSFVFSTLLRVPVGDVPYPLFVLVGLLPWIFFSTALASATDSVVGAASLVTKVYFPREVLPTAAVFTKVVDLGFGLIVLAGLMVYYGDPPELTSWWIPVLFLIQMIFTLGLAYPLAALNLFFHDVRFLVGVVLTMWFYVTPVIYSVDYIPSKYHFLFDLNPNSLFINAYRRVLLHGESPGLDKVLLGLAIATATFVIGYYLFKRMEPGFADRI